MTLKSTLNILTRGSRKFMLFSSLMATQMAVAANPTAGPVSNRAVSPPAFRCSSNAHSINSQTACMISPVLEMPRNYGVNAEFNREWWYYTGNAITTDNKRLGFMFAVTRAQIPFTKQTVYAATLSVMGEAIPNGHMQTMLVSKKATIENEGELMSLSLNENAENHMRFNHDLSKNSMVIEGKIKNGNKLIAIHLVADILPGKQVLHGMGGYSQKIQSDPQVASYYFSETRMDLASSEKKPENKIVVNQTEFGIKQGNVYHDHEISNFTSGELKSLAGWDWFGVQFFDSSRELVGFQMRDSKKAGAYSAKSLVKVDASGNYFTSNHQGDFSMTPMGEMKLKSGITYPAAFKVETTGPGAETFYLVPIAKEAEMLHLFNQYGWYEGAVDACKDIECHEKLGWGFLEMTGYARTASKPKANVLPNLYDLIKFRE
jgi:predicted secreted hydrolase